MIDYKWLIRDILANGEPRDDRTGVGTRALFGTTIKFDLQEGFPATTIKGLRFKSVAAELAGFLEGTRSAARMRELGTKIWDANANAASWQAGPNCDGPDDMGHVYGAKWRDFGGVDQLQELLKQLELNPASRRHLVTAWDPSEKRQCLPPCHVLWQAYISNDNRLSLQVYMRSVDVFLGLPFDVASFALLIHLIAQQLDLGVGTLTMLFGDTHIYSDHLDKCEAMLEKRTKRLPKLVLDEEASLNNFHPDMANLEGYEHHGFISAKMAV